MNKIFKILTYSLIFLALANLFLFLSRVQMTTSQEKLQQDDAPLEAITIRMQEIEKRLGRIESKLDKWATLYDVANCESELDHNAIGDNGKAKGVLQFHENTFNWLAGKAKVKEFQWLDRTDQLKIGLWALDNNYGYLWSCYGKEMQNEYDGK